MPGLRITEDLRRNHWHMFWVLQRDPLYDPLESEPAFVDLVKLDDSRMAEQRKILEQMRVVGDVPRR